jgi:hypothetical protein
MWDEDHDGSTSETVYTLDDVERYVRDRTPPHVDRAFWLFGDESGAHVLMVHADSTDEGGHSIEIEPCGECGELEGECVLPHRADFNRAIARLRTLGVPQVRRTAWDRILEADAE